MNYYSHHIGDFDRATRHLTRIERSIYRDLLDVYYDTEAPLTLDMPSLCRRVIARASDEAAAVEQVLGEFFIKTPSGWYHDRCEEELEKFRTSTSQKSAAGKASAAKREEKRQRAMNGNPTPVEQTLNECSTASQLTNNQEPITTNQEPELEPKKAKAKKSASPTFDPTSELALHGVPGNLVSDWLLVRKAKRAGAITQTVVTGLIAESEKAGLTPEAAISICCVRGWVGFNAGWVAGAPQARAGPGYQTPTEKAKLWAEGLTGKKHHEPGNNLIELIDINDAPAGYADP